MEGVDESGLNDMSKGRAKMFDRGKFCFLILSLIDGAMYPTVEKAGWSACAQLSLIMLCALSLLICLHLKVWSPQMLVGVPHVLVGELVGL